MSNPHAEHAPRLRTWILILGVVLSTAALSCTAWQAYLSREGVESQTWQNLMQPAYTISRAFLDHPELRPYFYDGKLCPKDDPNYSAVITICEMHSDFFDSFQDEYVSRLPGMSQKGKNRQLWDKYFRDMFASSPALSEFAKERQGWYSMDFSAYIPAEGSASNVK